MLLQASRLNIALLLYDSVLTRSRLNWRTMKISSPKSKIDCPLVIVLHEIDRVVTEKTEHLKTYIRLATQYCTVNQSHINDILHVSDSIECETCKVVIRSRSWPRILSWVYQNDIFHICVHWTFVVVLTSLLIYRLHIWSNIIACIRDNDGTMSLRDDDTLTSNSTYYQSISMYLFATTLIFVFPSVLWFLSCFSWALYRKFFFRTRSYYYKRQEAKKKKELRKKKKKRQLYILSSLAWIKDVFQSF